MSTEKVQGQKEKMLVMGKPFLMLLFITNHYQFLELLSSETIYETLCVATWMTE